MFLLSDFLSESYRSDFYEVLLSSYMLIVITLLLTILIYWVKIIVDFRYILCEIDDDEYNIL